MGHNVPHSKESILKCSMSQKKRWLDGAYKDRPPLSEETRRKISNTLSNKKIVKCHFCGKKKYLSPSLVNERNFCNKECFSKFYSGDNNHFYTGKTYKPYTHYRNKQYKNWRKEVYERDNYTCQDCNKKGLYLNPHHLFSYTYYPSLRYEVANGITLCVECHKLRHKNRKSR